MTIKDIAQICGCAVTTVSRVINNHPDVSEKTRQRILSVIEEYNFVPNSNAKNLKQQESDNILVIVCGTHNMLFSSMVELIQLEIQNRMAFSVVQYLSEDENEAAAGYNLAKEIKPKGIIFLGGNTEKFTEEYLNFEVPCVFITTDTSDLRYPNIMSVSTNDMEGGKAAIEYLLSMGHKKIGIISGDIRTSHAALLRYAGCKQAFAEAGLTFSDKNIACCKFNYEPAYTATNKLLDQYPELTAIYAMIDVMAVGTISAITDRGLRVPEDISVMGYDGIELASFYNPKITTLRQPQEDMAKAAVKELMKAISYGVKPYNALFDTQLVEGNSVIRYEERL